MEVGNILARDQPTRGTTEAKAFIGVVRVNANETRGYTYGYVKVYVPKEYIGRVARVIVLLD